MPRTVPGGPSKALYFAVNGPGVGGGGDTTVFDFRRCSRTSIILASERDTYRGNTFKNGEFLLVYILVVCLSTNGERALNYTIVK